MKNRWWTLIIQDYPNYQLSDVDLEHIAELIKEGYTNGELTRQGDSNDF